MKVPEKVGSSVGLRQLGGGDASNTSVGVRTGVPTQPVKDRVSPGLLAEAFLQASVKRDERLSNLRRAIADGTYRADSNATADGVASDGRIVVALLAAWTD